MLMFGNDKKKAISVMLGNENKVDQDVNLDKEAMKSAIMKLMKGLQTGDADLASEGFESAFRLCELKPHEEVEKE